MTNDYNLICSECNMELEKPKQRRRAVCLKCQISANNKRALKRYYKNKGHSIKVIHQ